MFTVSHCFSKETYTHRHKKLEKNVDFSHPVDSWDKCQSFCNTGKLLKGISCAFLKTCLCPNSWKQPKEIDYHGVHVLFMPTNCRTFLSQITCFFNLLVFVLICQSLCWYHFLRSGCAILLQFFCVFVPLWCLIN